jgi:hypothetical protein
MKKGMLILMLGILLVGTVIALEMEQTVTVTVLSGAIEVHSPIHNSVYDHRMVPVNLTMSSEVNYFKYSDNGGNFRTLCRECDEYGSERLKRKPFDDGAHQLIIKAMFDSGDIFHYANFTVDTKDPKITSTMPRRGFADGWFSIDYKEQNPTSMFLNYGNDLVGWRSQEVDLEDCYSPRRNKDRCDVEVNLSDYDLQEIKYWFNLTDLTNAYDDSRPRAIEVDVSPPRIDYFNYTRAGRSTYMNINITEENFDKILYIDYADKRPKWRTLCSRLRNKACEKRKLFREGERNISINVLDEALNSAMIENIIFEVDY